MDVQNPSMWKLSHDAQPLAHILTNSQQSVEHNSRQECDNLQHEEFNSCYEWIDKKITQAMGWTKKSNKQRTKRNMLYWLEQQLYSPNCSCSLLLHCKLKKGYVPTPWSS